LLWSWGCCEPSRRRNFNGWKRTTDGPQTGDQVRTLAEEDGEEPDRIEDGQEKEVKSLPPVRHGYPTAGLVCRIADRHGAAWVVIGEEAGSIENSIEND
jgi:hypothetical protein